MHISKMRILCLFICIHIMPMPMFTNQKLTHTHTQREYDRRIAENGIDGRNTNRKISFVFHHYSVKKYDDAMNNEHRERE